MKFYIAKSCQNEEWHCKAMLQKQTEKNIWVMAIIPQPDGRKENLNAFFSATNGQNDVISANRK